MIERLGNALYWLCNIVAALIAIWGVCDFLFGNVSGSEHYLGLFAVVFALAIYGLGRGVRYVLAGR